MTLNPFIAVVCVVVATILTIALVRFFFGEDTKTQGEQLFHQSAHKDGEPTSAGDTLRTRRTDTAEDIQILHKQMLVGAILTLIVVIPIIIHAFAPHCPLGPLINPWWQAIMITPVMFYSGYPVHVDGWSSIRDRHPNINSLASIGTIAAYAYGLLICFAGDIFPEPLRTSYFAVVGIVITLILLARLVSDMYLPAKPAFPMQMWVDRFSRVFVPVIIAISMWTFVIWLIFAKQPSLPVALLTSISVLIIACPCALGWSAPLAAVFANENASKRGITVHTFGSLQIAQHVTDVLYTETVMPLCQRDIQQLQRNGVSTSVINTKDIEGSIEAIGACRQLTTSLGQHPVVAFVDDGTSDQSIRDAADISFVLQTSSSAEPRADVVVTEESGTFVSNLRNLSHAMMLNIKENLVWVFAFNIIGIPIAAGILYPFTSWLLDPSFAAIAMILSSLAVLLNSLRLRRYDPSRDLKTRATMNR